MDPFPLLTLPPELQLLVVGWADLRTRLALFRAGPALRRRALSTSVHLTLTLNVRTYNKMHAVVCLVKHARTHASTRTYIHTYIHA